MPVVREGGEGVRGGVGVREWKNEGDRVREGSGDGRRERSS